MQEKQLGKIDFAEFGTIKDYPFLIGLQLGFQLGDKTWIGNGVKYTVNIQTIEFINDILKDAKVNYVSELINKPVEVTIENNTFKDFRILTEVL